jgi:hypothetical protein
VPRSDAQDRAFRVALSKMQVVYAHKMTLVYMLTQHPQWTISPMWESKPCACVH